MRNIKLSTFFRSEYVDYASYDNLRKIGSVIDGQKNASRKVIHTLLAKNIKSETKVSQLASTIEKHSEYLHGSIAGVLVNMGQDYVGANNFPLVLKSGNFGTRYVTAASATRYIYASSHSNLTDVIDTRDNTSLVHQIFEGNMIEPRYFIPTLPLLLCNGSEGVSSGFAQKILPRNPKEIVKELLNYINDTDIETDMTPYYEGYKGTIEQGENQRQWLIKGKINRVSATKVTIEEIPVGYALKDYLEILDDLEDNKVIVSYEDKSEDDEFLFDVKISRSMSAMSDDELMTKLKLIKKVTENYTCINAKNRIQVFNNVWEMIDTFIGTKIFHMQKRYEYITKNLETQTTIAQEKYRFIKMVVDDELIINKRKKADIEKDLVKHKFITVNDKYDYLLNMNITSLTLEKMKELKAAADQMIAELKVHKKLTPNDLWKTDLNTI